MGTPPFFTIPPGCAIASWRPPSWNNWNNYSQNKRSILLLGSRAPVGTPARFDSERSARGGGGRAISS